MEVILGVKNEKLMFVLKLSSIIYPEAWFRQTRCIAVMTKEGSTLIANFMTPLSRGFCARVLGVTVFMTCMLIATV